MRGRRIENSWGRWCGGRKPPEGQQGEAPLGRGSGGPQTPALELPTWLQLLSLPSQELGLCGGHLSSRGKAGKPGPALNWSHGAWVPSWASLSSCKMARGRISPSEAGERDH